MKPAAVKKNAIALRDAIAAEAEEQMHAAAPSAADADDADCTCSIGHDDDDGGFASLPEAVYRSSNFTSFATPRDD